MSTYPDDYLVLDEDPVFGVTAAARCACGELTFNIRASDITEGESGKYSVSAMSCVRCGAPARIVSLIFGASGSMQ